MTPRQTRRSVLKTGAAIGGLAVTGALAGCSDLLGDGGSASYTNWMYAPGAVEVDGGNENETQNGNESEEAGNHYSFTYLDDSEIRANEDNFDDGYNESEQIQGYPLQQMGVDDYGDIDNRVVLGLNGTTTVVNGSFSEDDVVSELEDNDFEADGEYSGYAVYTGEGGLLGGTQVLAIDGGTVVSARGSPQIELVPPRDSVEAVIDTDEGEEDRYVDENEDMKVLTDELGDGVSVLGGTQMEAEETDLESGIFAGQVASGQVAEIDGDTTEQTFVIVFAGSGDVDTDEIEEWTETSSGAFAGVDNVSVSSSGRVATITGEIDTVDAFGGSS